MKINLSTVWSLGLVVAPALALGTLLPACVLNRALPNNHRTYRISGAVVRNVIDGTVATVDLGNTTLDPSAVTTVDFFSLPEGRTDTLAEARVQTWFKQYLNQRLGERATEPANETFVSTFGSGSAGSDWCLLSPPTLEDTMGAIAGPSMPRPPVADGAPMLLACTDPVLASDCEATVGATPTLSFGVPSPFTFPDTGVGSDSAVQAIRLSNFSSANLCVSLRSRLLDGPDGDSFTLDPGAPSDPDSCVPHTIDPSAQRVLLAHLQSCTLRVSFHPTRTGTHLASVPISSNDSLNPSLVVSGTGIGGQLTVTADPPASATSDADGNRACVPRGADNTILHVTNTGPVVTIQSAPSDPSWSISDVTLPGSSVPVPPWVLENGVALSFRVRGSGASSPPGTLSFGGTQQNNPFDIRITTCP